MYPTILFYQGRVQSFLYWLGQQWLLPAAGLRAGEGWAGVGALKYLPTRNQVVVLLQVSEE